MKKTGVSVPGVVIAIIEGEGNDGLPVVRLGSETAPPRSIPTVWMESPPDWSTCTGLRAVLGFVDGDESSPILLGLLDEPASGEAPRRKPQVLKLESEQELVLECGKAKISLRADGRVVILGGYVLSRSKGVNKIKGGSVQIN